jgi:hypothetical protein
MKDNLMPIHAAPDPIHWVRKEIFGQFSEQNCEDVKHTLLSNTDQTASDWKNI